MNRWYLLAILTVFEGATQVESRACTTIIVGREASVDGSTIIARNNDGQDALSTKSIYQHPRGSGPYHYENRLTRFSYFTNTAALAYVAFPPSYLIGSNQTSSEEAGSNERGVSVSATETIINGPAGLAIDPYTTNGITEDDITTILLSQARSARHGIKILGDVINEQGAGAGFGVIVSDVKEVWYLETATGHHWLAQRIPDRSYFVSANQGRFQSVNFKQRSHSIASRGLLPFALKNGLWLRDGGNPFNYLESFMSNTEWDTYYNHPRVARLLYKYSGVNFLDAAPFFPVFPRPKDKISVWDVAEGLRDHYQGTVQDPYNARGSITTYRPISLLRTIDSHIIQKKPSLPSDISTVIYLALGMTELSPYIPIYNGLEKYPPQLQGSDPLTDEESLYLKMRRLQALVFQDYQKYSPWAKGAISDLESFYSNNQVQLEKAYRTAYKTHGKKYARNLIDDFTKRIVLETILRIDDLSSVIIRDLGIDYPSHADMINMLINAEKKYHFGGS